MESIVLFIVFTLLILAGIGIFFYRSTVRSEKAANWPMTEGTIQSVNRVYVGRGVSIDVGDFYYNVNNGFYSGRLTISRSTSAGDRSPKDLINQKIQVHYNPQNPDEFSVTEVECGGFLLGPYNVSFGKDIDPTDLNLDKI